MDCPNESYCPSTVMRTLLVAALAWICLPATSQAQTTFSACRVPDVGAIYMVGVEGAPEDCLDPSHVPFSWTEGAGAVGCAPGTRRFAGACFEEGTRAALNWFEASEECGAAGGRLPTASELRGFRLEDGITLADPEVSSNIFYLFDDFTWVYVAVNEVSIGPPVSSTPNEFRCVFSLYN